MKIFFRAGLLIFIAGLAALFFFIDPNKNALFPRCPFNALTGLYCPGCGSQRAIHDLLHFNFAGVAGNNFLFLPAVIAVAYHYARPFLNKKFGWNLFNLIYWKHAPWIILSLILLFWLLRNLPVHPFSFLAPG